MYPAKEVVWDEPRIDALESRLRELPEFSSGAKELIEHLRDTGTVEGEELFFPVAFEKPSSILDYSPGQTIWRVRPRRQSFFSIMTGR